MREVLAAVEHVVGRSLDIRDAPRRVGNPPELVTAVSRIAESLGWRPKHDDLDVIVRTAIEWKRRLASAGSTETSLRRYSVGQ